MSSGLSDFFENLFSKDLNTRYVLLKLYFFSEKIEKYIYEFLLTM